MQIIRKLSDYCCDRPSVVTIGSFDGVHRGHQALIRQLTDTARDEGLRSIVVTFDPHPRIALGRGEGLVLLTDTDEKCRWLAHYGVDTVVILPFDKQLAALSGETFAQELLCKRLQARVLIAGYNHRLGHDRIAATELDRGALRVISVGRCELDGRVVSSSEVRRALATGNRLLAEQLLGHPIKLTEQ